jgi:hypothetical protein
MWRLWSATAVMALILVGTGVSTATGDANRELACGNREILIAMMLEADGAPPNSASQILDEEAFEFSRARAGCQTEDHTGALAIYDRIASRLYDSVVNRSRFRP